MSHTPWHRSLAVIAFTVQVATSQLVYGSLLLNYQFESVDGAPPSGQTTPDSSGNFASAPGTVNAVLGHGTQTPGTDFPSLVAGPVENTSAGVRSRNPKSAMDFPGNPASGSIGSNIERVEIADASSGALDATFSNFTVALWLNPSSTDRDRFAIGKIGGSGQRGWQVYSAAGTTDLIFDYFDAAGGSDRSLVVPDALPLNTWTHVILAFDGSNQADSVYVNNVLQSANSVGTLTSVPATLNAANNQPFRVGHRGATGSGVAAWAGGIDDVMIFDETLAHTAAGGLTGTGSTLVPEPSSLTLAIFGLATAVGLGQRKRSQ